MQYYDDIVSRFVANYSSNHPVEIPNIGMVTISGGTVAPTEQPTNAPWLRLSITAGSTFNATIGTLSTIKKRDLFDVAIQVLLPRTKTTNGSVFTYTEVATIERSLDAFMLINGLQTAGETGLLYSDQAEPKFKATPTPTSEGVWLTSTITYQYLYEYI